MKGDPHVMSERSGTILRPGFDSHALGIESGVHVPIAQHTSLIQQVNSAVRTVLSGRGRGPDEEMIFAGRLLSLRHAESFREGAGEVRVAPGTVVTPLARDCLKRRGIGLRVVSRSAVDAVRDLGEWGFSIEVESGLVAAMRRAWLDGPEPWIELAPGAGPAAWWVVEGPGRGAMLLTDEPSVAVWRACRVDGVRAASAGEPEAVARAVRRLGVNFLVIEPAGAPISLVRQLGRAFRKAGAPRIPDGLDWEGLA